MTREPDVLVLAYHAVGDLEAGAYVASADLDRQLALLVVRGYDSASFVEAILEPHSAPVVAVTFDDGHESVLTEALPALRRHGMVGTVFPRLDLLGRPGSLSATGLRQLGDAGWEVGSHTLTHPNLNLLSDDELERELCGSKAELEALLGRPCRSIAYPLGAADARVVAAAVAAGYEAGAALYGVPAAYGRLAWPRVGVHGGEGLVLFRLRLSRALRALRSSPGRARAVDVAAYIPRAVAGKIGRHT